MEVVDFTVEAESDMNFDADYPHVEPLGYFVEDHFTVVRIGEGEIVAELSVRLSVKVSVDFSFSVHDSMDNDEVPMGSVHIVREMEIGDNAQVLVTFSGDFEAEGEWEVSDVEIASVSSTIDLGFVEPDWRNRDEPPDDEDRDPYQD